MPGATLAHGHDCCSGYRSWTPSGSPSTATRPRASVAYRVNDVIAIYPITPSSAMGELADAWSAEGRPNIWGAVPSVIEMQSRRRRRRRRPRRAAGGRAGDDVHRQPGPAADDPEHVQDRRRADAVLSSTSRRATVATHALSIFGDHRDVMAVPADRLRACCASAIGAGGAGLRAASRRRRRSRARVPFLHFFDGFRTSHEVAKIEPLDDDDLRAMIDDDPIAAHRARALTPDRPVIRGTAQNPDVVLPGSRGRATRFYDALPRHRPGARWTQFAALTGRALPAVRVPRRIPTPSASS